MPDPATYRPAPGSIPVEPGVYRFRDPHGRVIYVGKAKSLRSRLNSYFADISGLAPRTRQMVTTAAQRRVDGGQHRGRGAAARVQLDQGVRPAVQRPLPRRQVLPGAGGDAQRGVPAADGLPRAAPQGRALLRAVLARLGHPRDARSADPGVPGPHLLGGSVQAAQPDRAALPARATSTSARRRASGGSAPRSTGEIVLDFCDFLAGKTDRLAREHGTADERRGRASWTSSGRRGCGTTSRRAASGRWRSRPWCSATAPTPTSSRSPTTSWRPPSRCSTSAAAGCAASAAGSSKSPVSPANPPRRSWSSSSSPSSTATRPS